MIKRLKIKFMLISMVSIFAVLSSIIGVINVSNYTTISKNADEILNVIQKNGGFYPIWGDVGLTSSDGESSEITAETIYQTSYFSVYNISSENPIVSMGFFSKIDRETALECSKIVAKRSEDRGYVKRYRYMKTEDNAIFMDCDSRLKEAEKLLTSSLLISAGGLLAVFILIWFLTDRMLLPVKKSYEKQKRFIANASHELKTPLTIISANNELIEIENGPSESNRIIEKQVKRMNMMVKNLTTLAKLDEINRSIEMAEIDLSAALKSLIEPYSKMLNKEGKVTVYDIKDDVKFVGNPNLISQLLSALIDNMNKYMKSQGEITLSENKRSILIRTSNDCEDLEQGSLDKYFDRFARGNNTNIEGSGIGLSMAKEVVEIHKGKIKAIGRNERFIIEITFKKNK